MQALGSPRVSLRLELINQTSAPVRAIDEGQRFDGRDYVTRIVLEDARERGPITQGLGTAIEGLR